ncbi:MAG: hypothetical protein JWR24_5580 [Actinoallomurus sp.]|nr:hypothetical protein [Actinoallomurus sp.]
MPGARPRAGSHVRENGLAAERPEPHSDHDVLYDGD